MPELNEYEFDRLERYVLGKMSPEERAAFAKEIEGNPALREEVNAMKEMILAIEVGAFRDSLSEIHDSLGEERMETRNRKSLWYGMAASLAILIGISVWFYFIREEEGAGDLYAQYAYTDPGLPVPMSASSTYSFYDGMVDFKMEAYGKAAEKWSPLLRKNPDNDTLQYYLASALFQEGNLEEARSYFSKVLAQPESKFRDKAQYMEVLIDLREGNYKAIRSVEPYPGSRFAERIESLQKAIK
jgi:tetratricopeptide (TPR) repeat protein